MRMFTVLLGKECREVIRTWRLPVFASVLGFFAVLSPIAAAATPALLRSLTASQPGVVISIPDPVALDAFAQWIKNLSQIGTLLIVFSAGAGLAGEIAAGTAAAIAVRPISRVWLVVAKYCAMCLLLGVIAIAGAGIVWIGTRLIFGPSASVALWRATAAWYAWVVTVASVTMIFSAVMPAVAAGASGIAVLAVSGLLGMWEPAARYSAIALTAAPQAYLSGDRPDMTWPLLCAAATVAFSLWLAGYLFGRREL